ncbi:MAG TPA: PepSY domain-containing protein [Bacteriovoracaceae bacterium]|nr:PepSY domain-containing protein [Bacteriovoracaceae bacterium]
MNIRKPHRIVAVSILIPLAMMSITGLMLLMRNEIEWIQPKTVTAAAVTGQMLAPEHVLKLAGPGVDQIIYRPGKNNISVRMVDGMEAQYHSQTGELLKNAPRRSGFLIELHQGSWMGPVGQYGIHLMSGLGLVFLLISGMMIWPFGRKKI